MLNYRFKSNHLVPLLLVTLLCLFGVTLLNSGNTLPANGDPVTAKYKEDINEDGTVNIFDLITLLNLGKNDPENPAADYNEDGHYSIMDVILLLVNIANGKLTPLTYIFSGRVVLDGQCLAGVEVGIKNELVDTVVITDSYGIYCIECLEIGTYTLTPSKTDYLFIPKSVEVSIDADPVTVPDIDALLANYTISGRILMDSVGLGNVAVRCEGGPDISGYELMIKKKTKTDSLGMFTFKGLPDGNYELWCKHSIHNYSFSPDPLKLQISGESKSLGIEARPAGYTLRGRVIENYIGLPDVSVKIMGVGLDTVVVTDSTGIYGLTGALDANYSVTCEKENYTFNPVSTTVSVAGDSVNVTDIKATYVDPSAAQELHIISGRVYCRVQAQMDVVIILTGDLEASTVTDGNGFFTFSVPNGEYKIIGIPNATFQMFNPPFINLRVQGADILTLEFYAWGTHGP